LYVTSVFLILFGHAKQADFIKRTKQTFVANLYFALGL